MHNIVQQGLRIVLPAIALATAGAAMAEQRLRGTIIAAPGHDVHDTLVYVCDLSRGTTCPLSELREFKFDTERGSSTPFSLLLPPNEAGYGLTAWQDTNGDGKVGLGDQLGVYFTAGAQKLTPVHVPAEGVILQMVIAGQGKAPPAPPYVALGGADGAKVAANASRPAPAAAGAAGQAPGRLGSLVGEWAVSGSGKDVEYGPKLKRSYTGLPAGQTMGVIGTGQVGTYAWGTSYEYQTYDVERQGALRIQPSGAFTWASVSDSKRSADCFRVTDIKMSGRAALQGNKLILDITDGRQTVSYRGCSGAQTSVKTEVLAGQRRGYEVKLANNVLSIRQVEPVSAVSSAVAYQRR